MTVLKYSQLGANMKMTKNKLYIIISIICLTLLTLIVTSAVIMSFIIITFFAPIKESELYGTYIAKYDFGAKEILVLKPNGECFQEATIIVDSNSKTITNTGQWKYDAKDKRITFEHFLYISTWQEKLNNNYSTPSGPVLLPVSKLFPWSSIKIEIDPDCGYSYVKE